MYFSFLKYLPRGSPILIKCPISLQEVFVGDMWLVPIAHDLLTWLCYLHDSLVLGLDGVFWFNVMLFERFFLPASILSSVEGH